MNTSHSMWGGGVIVVNVMIRPLKVQLNKILASLGIVFSIVTHGNKKAI